MLRFCDIETSNLVNVQWHLECHVLYTIAEISGGKQTLGPSVYPAGVYHLLNKIWN
jgi:hypothetical protein